jgi:pyruvate dehydrogenase E2 component (dihydrolipoamide acetyltransferase)
MASAEIVMPFLNETMEEGTVGHWLKKVGDHVEFGDELVEIETDKASMVYEADESGTLIEICVQEGETVPVGTVIAKLNQAA